MKIFADRWFRDEEMTLAGTKFAVGIGQLALPLDHRRGCMSLQSCPAMHPGTPGPDPNQRSSLFRHRFALPFGAGPWAVKLGRLE